jgi:hypothetical protein
MAASVLLAASSLSLSACGGSSVPVLSQNAHAADYAAWSNSLARLPAAGCFEASFPSMVWKPVGCSTQSNLLFPTGGQRGVRPGNVGGSYDQITAWVNAPALIQQSIGSFPSVKGVKSEKSVPINGGASLGPNTFTLQMNANTFPTRACGPNVNCIGWEQFVYENKGLNGKSPSVFVYPGLAHSDGL